MIKERMKKGYKFLRSIWTEGAAVTTALKRTYASYKVCTNNY